MISEIYYLVTSLWRHQFYFMYFYLGLSMLVMGYVASTISAIQTYAQLSQSRYDWWWPSFLVGFFVGFDLFVVMCNYMFFSNSKGDNITFIKYMIWSFMICTLAGLVAGTMSFFGSLFFIKKIYKRVAEKGKNK